jgi:hypothetical protein
MSKGADSQAGFSAQNWAALSLFIQFSRYHSFRRIELEQPKLADFVLVFDNKRIVCESKKSHVTYSDIREIFDTLPILNSNDEILVICTSTGPRLKEDLENAYYFAPAQEQLIKTHKFTSRHLGLLSRLKLWVVDEELNREIVRNLLGERFQSWLPEDELDDLLNTLLIKNIYEKSTEGGIYSKADFDLELQQRRELLKQKDDYKYKERSAKEIVNKLLAELKDTDSRLQSDNRLKAIIADTGLHYFAIKEITKANDLNVPLWDNFWLATFSSYYSREVLSIFEKNINDQKTATYTTRFIGDNLYKLRFRSTNEFELKSCADILMKAVEVAPELISDTFDLMKIIYKYSTENLLFTEENSRVHDEWLLGELSKDFATLYEKADEDLKSSIVDYIYKSFNLVDESYENWHHTPFEFLEVIRDDLLSHPRNFEDFLSRIRLQYIDFFEKFGAKYNGWELMGGGVSNFGGDYKVHDKAFINTIIWPFIDRLSLDEKWDVANKYATVRVGEVSDNKPDFMNRALIPFLLDQYTNGSETAFRILSDFTRMRKGIPHKAELVFFYTRDSHEMSVEQKWSLLEVAIKEYGFPINVFMDQVLWELLEKKYTKAIKVFSDLLDNKDYMNRQLMFDNTVIESLLRVINNDTTFDQGVDLLVQFLSSEHFIKSLDSFHSYDAKVPVINILNKDFDKGLAIMQSLIRSKAPTANQQRVFGAILRDTPDELLGSIYESLVKPELQSFDSAIKLAQKYTNTETRENFVWFAEKLSKKQLFDDALNIAEFFINDPDPSKDNQYDKEIADGKYDFTITTVRGCISWVILPVNSAAGREYIKRAFEITKRLCTDDSLYVRQMSLPSLEALANNRHTKMPDNKVWFMDYSTAKAIEDFAFAMLEDKSNDHPAIARHLARVFNRIRTLGGAQAIEVINTFAKYKDKEILKELDSFIIFMAEFRKAAFGNWPKSRGTISAYDPKPIQEMLKEFLENGPDEHRESLAWHIVKLPEEPTKNSGELDRLFNISYRYMLYAIKKYDQLVFSSLHRFIEKHIDRKFDKCYDLWRKSLPVERKAIDAESKKDIHSGEYSWWPYHYNGSILLKVLANKGVEQFLKDLEFLVDYPPQVNIAMDIDKVLAELELVRPYKDDVTRIYEKLINRNYLFNDSYEKWLANSVQ